MPLEMVQRNDNIRIHDRPADMGNLAVLSAFNRHVNIVGAAYAVRYNVLTAGGKGGKAVFGGS